MEKKYDIEIGEDYSLGETKEEVWGKLKGTVDGAPEKMDADMIGKAFMHCYDYHEGLLRASGLPYYMHPVSVALILINEMRVYDSETVVIALLHDTIEDVKKYDERGRRLTSREIEDVRCRRREAIGSEFGGDVLRNVESVTKIKHSKTGFLTNIALTHRKLLLSIVPDPRAMLVKLADRIHNMRTLDYLPIEKRKSISDETIHFYTVIARRLGLTKVKNELQDRSLYYLNQNLFADIKNRLQSRRSEFVAENNAFHGRIGDILKENDIPHHIIIVHKHIYELYKEILRGRKLGDIRDIYSIVIVVESEDENTCYDTLDLLEKEFQSVSTLKDGISRPRISWYKALGIHLLNPSGLPVEVLIRTEEMEKVADSGIASEVTIRSGNVKALDISSREIEKWGEFMQWMIAEKGEDAALSIWDSIKRNLFDKDLEVTTPTGQPVTLPKGSCPVDFAFALSEHIGLHYEEAWVNGEIVSPDYKLRNGDKIYIKTREEPLPEVEWLDFTVYHKAKAGLYGFFRDKLD